MTVHCRGVGGTVCSRASPLTAHKLGNQIDAAMFFAGGLRKRTSLAAQEIPISIASPVPGGNTSQFVRNLVPDFTHYIRETHENT